MLRISLTLFVASFLSTGCCKDRVLTKPAGPKVEEYPLPPAPPLK